MPAIGDILLYKNFEFEDGTKKDKLCIALNNSSSKIPCLFLITTSQSRHYPNINPGCNFNKKLFFIPVQWKAFFSVDTYIQLPMINELRTYDLHSNKFADQISVRGNLPDEVNYKLIQCLRLFRDDISDQHWNIIFPDS